MKLQMNCSRTPFKSQSRPSSQSTIKAGAMAKCHRNDRKVICNQSTQGQTQTASKEAAPENCWQCHQKKAGLAPRLKWRLGTQTNWVTLAPQYRTPVSTINYGSWKRLPREECLGVFVDMSKAFDTVWKNGLLLKPLSIGIQGKMYNMLSNIDSQHTTRLKLNETLSSLRKGVPQGGVISPTHVLVYIIVITTTAPKHLANALHTGDFAVRDASDYTSIAT